MANQKLKEEEVKSLQDLQQKNAALINELGSIELANISLEERRENAEKFLADLREEEKELAKSLEDTYGVGSIDLVKGEFIPAPAKEEEVAEEVAE
tara:strand:+ start:116 stop:403 length:288 start_codon:yes stop_codon:yes gene_type:complete